MVATNFGVTKCDFTFQGVTKQDFTKQGFKTDGDKSGVKLRYSYHRGS
jgi:hypothetical protein